MRLTNLANLWCSTFSLDDPLTTNGDPYYLVKETKKKITTQEDVTNTQEEKFKAQDKKFKKTREEDQGEAQQMWIHEFDLFSNLNFSQPMP